MVGDSSEDRRPDRDIIVKTTASPLQRISPLHPYYMSLQYVLLFPDGRDGWSHDIPF